MRTRWIFRSVSASGPFRLKAEATGLGVSMRIRQLQLRERTRTCILDVAELFELREVVLHRALPCAIVRCPPPAGVVRRPAILQNPDRPFCPHPPPPHR